MITFGDELVMQPGPAEHHPGKVGCPDRPHLHHLTAQAFTQHLYLGQLTAPEPGACTAEQRTDTCAQRK